MSRHKAAVAAVVDALEPTLREIALRIHASPELGFEEHKAVEWLTAPLRGDGFSVRSGVGGLTTAFRADHVGRGSGPTVGLLAEYDALPGLGHACGHNLIGTAAVGAAIAIARAIPDHPGTIGVIGCPAEEGGGGKILMADRGVFDDIDAAMLCHPHRRTMTIRDGLAAQRVTFKFFGKASHAASAPAKGVSALDALIHTFVAMNSLRQFFPDGSRIHGIITRGGDAVNVVPEYAEALFLIRAQDVPALERMKVRVLQCAQAQASAVGATVAFEDGLLYAERKPNHVIAGLFGANLEALGLEVREPPPGGLGSSDIGNVGLKCPIIHPYVQIVPEDISNHTAEFAEAAGSEAGLSGMVHATKALAMTAVDLLFHQPHMDAARNEWQVWLDQRKAD